MITHRPYPKDFERKLRVMSLLYKHGITLKDLAKNLDTHHSSLCAVVWGVRKSPVMETRVSEYFGLKREQLFPIANLQRGAA